MSLQHLPHVLQHLSLAIDFNARSEEHNLLKWSLCKQPLLKSVLKSQLEGITIRMLPLMLKGIHEERLSVIFRVDKDMSVVLLRNLY